MLWCVWGEPGYYESNSDPALKEVEMKQARCAQPAMRTNSDELFELTSVRTLVEQFQLIIGNGLDVVGDDISK